MKFYMGLSRQVWTLHSATICLEVKGSDLWWGIAFNCARVDCNPAVPPQQQNMSFMTHVESKWKSCNNCSKMLSIWQFVFAGNF